MTPERVREYVEADIARRFPAKEYKTEYHMTYTDALPGHGDEYRYKVLIIALQLRDNGLYFRRVIFWNRKNEDIIPPKTHIEDLKAYSGLTADGAATLFASPLFSMQQTENAQRKLRAEWERRHIHGND